MKLRKILLLIFLPLMLVCASVTAGTCICTSEPVSVYAAEEIISASSEEIEGSAVTSSGEIEETINSSVVEEENTEINIKEYLQNAFDSFVAPLLTGVSITSIVSLLVSVIFAYLNRKNNKNNAEIQKTNRKDIQTTIQMFNEYKISSDKIIEELEKQNQVSKETKNEFVKKSEALLKQCEQMNKDVEHLEGLKEVMVDLATIISKIARSSNQLVSSGVAKDVTKLEEHIRKL